LIVFASITPVSQIGYAGIPHHTGRFVSLDQAIQFVHRSRRTVRWSVASAVLSTALPGLSFSKYGISGVTAFYAACSIGAWINVLFQLRTLRAARRFALVTQALNQPE
jgi:O-antigen/teichoic acid export membrane protein